MTQPSTTEAPAVVMIVDDVPANLAMLHDALEQAGYRVRVATSGVRALESVQLEPPDLILLDAVMPGLDGFETCRRLKSDLVTRHIPVLFMTGLTDSDDVVRGFECGGADYVTKPVRTQEVLARIGAHLSNARVMAEAQQAADAAGDAIVAVDVMARPELLRISRPSSTFVPSKRTTSGTFSPSSLVAATTPLAMTSQRMMPPKMFTKMPCTAFDSRMILNACVTASWLAPPPTSRKFAGSPP